MADREGTTPEVESFITRWLGSGAAERSNYQLFLSGLCRLLGVPEPEPATADDSRNAYVFERAVTFTDGDGRTTTNFIDLYKRGCLLLEANRPGAGRARPPGRGRLPHALSVHHVRRGCLAAAQGQL
jgi:hypothetical protein